MRSQHLRANFCSKIFKLIEEVGRVERKVFVQTNFCSYQGTCQVGWTQFRHSMSNIFFFSKSLLKLILEYLRQLKGVSLKTWPFHFLLFQHILFNSLATNMLESRDLYHSKGEIHSSVWSTKTFLYNIREPRYKQNNMRYKISRI